MAKTYTKLNIPSALLQRNLQESNILASKEASNEGSNPPIHAFLLEFNRLK